MIHELSNHLACNRLSVNKSHLRCHSILMASPSRAMWLRGIIIAPMPPMQWTWSQMENPYVMHCSKNIHVPFLRARHMDLTKNFTSVNWTSSLAIGWFQLCNIAWISMTAVVQQKIARHLTRCKSYCGEISAQFGSHRFVL